ncbi:hypothetical protein AUI06_04990 [archaeon 13_2_20CM_2_52_21]|nr:MAG: hypothetical protein AUI06_04990 [archaeon 13_2_20CM_2_52_21]
MNFWKLLFRSWFYFRIGYNTYFAFLIGFASNIIVIYKLGIAENKILSTIQIGLTFFAVLALLIMVPLCISIGLYHMRRTGAFAAEASVGTESNPYMYKIIPGKEREVFLPLWIATVRGLARVLDREKTMTAEEKRQLEDILSKADALLKGEFIGYSGQQSLGRTA